MDTPTTLLANSSNISTVEAISNKVEKRQRGIVSDDVYNTIFFINCGLICGFFVIFGSIVNSINIVAFVKIGFKETINISLLAIYISDFWCCFSMLFFSLCVNPAFKTLDLPFDPTDFYYHSGCAHILFSRITSSITAFITLERCLCVAAPLKVKEIITPKRVAVFIISIALSISVLMYACFYSAEYVWEFYPARNKSILVVKFNQEVSPFEIVLKSFHSIIIPIATFLVVVISTIYLVLTLKRKTAWRQKTTSSAQSSSSSSSLSARDAKASKMVVRIAILFIVCYVPGMCSYIIECIEPEYDTGMKYHNLSHVMFSFFFVFECINSSLNIFIYYNTSSIYKAAFLKLFCRHNTETAANHEHNK